MTKLLLPGIAALFLTTGTAQAVELPPEMTGRWELCRETEHQEIFVRREEEASRACTTYGTTYFWETGNSGPGRLYCEYDRIEKTAPGIYRAHALCTGGNSGIPADVQEFEYTELEIIDGQLVVTDIDEG